MATLKPKTISIWCDKICDTNVAVEIQRARESNWLFSWGIQLLEELCKVLQFLQVTSPTVQSCWVDASVNSVLLPSYQFLSQILQLIFFDERLLNDFTCLSPVTLINVLRRGSLLSEVVLFFHVSYSLAHEYRIINVQFKFSLSASGNFRNNNSGTLRNPCITDPNVGKTK